MLVRTCFYGGGESASKREKILQKTRGTPLPAADGKKTEAGKSQENRGPLKFSVTSSSGCKNVGGGGARRWEKTSRSSAWESE